MRKEKKLIPVLRFPEFVNKGEWVEKQHGEICKMQAGKFVSASDIKENYIGGLFPCYGGNGLRGYTKSFTHKGKYSLIGRQGALCGNVILADGTFHATEHAIVVTPEKKVDTVWLFYMLGYLNLNQYATGQAQPGLSVTNLEKVELTIPNSNEEQQKIASCLSSLDEVITAEIQKLDLLKHHKKGLLQNLFPQEGETVPKYRFKEYENSGEWQEKALAEIAEIITGNTPPTNDICNYNGKKLFVSPADISETRFVIKTKTTLTEAGFTLTRHIKENSVLFVCIGSTIGKVAQNKFECATNQQINSLVTYEGFSSDFLYSLLENNSSKIASIAGKHAVPIINKTSFSLVKLQFPAKLEEQQKIAYCLSSLDEVISVQIKKIEALKQHKKGLLQGLFPKIEA